MTVATLTRRMTKDKPLFTLTEYLEKHKIDLDRSQLMKAARFVALAYKEIYKEDPPEAYRPNEKGKSIRMGKGYPIEFVGEIEKVLKSL